MNNCETHGGARVFCAMRLPMKQMSCCSIRPNWLQVVVCPEVIAESTSSSRVMSLARCANSEMSSS